ncbi:hypothetical protein AAHA92_16634 [Salvia divinorum]|uniref:Uncharacterized protein n=1 Tax=Salvia divinorum TaxID=28513 RepID=A0ABD1GW62_SALDI
MFRCCAVLFDAIYLELFRIFLQILCCYIEMILSCDGYFPFSQYYVLLSAPIKIDQSFIRGSICKGVFTFLQIN